MDTTSRAAGVVAAALDGYLAADFPWYGLDDGWTGNRWLMQVGAGAEGTVDYGSVGHGDEPTARQYEGPDSRRFAVVVTVARRPGRRSADGTGVLEATSASSAAWLAGSGLLSATWPGQMGRSLRQDWLDQQTAIAWDLADDLAGPNWSSLSLPVGGRPQDFRYRESEYGWVLAGEAPGVLLGAYGRGVSAYALGFADIADIARYAEPGPSGSTALGAS
ncbi:hypothetical protein ACIQGZ_05845 [Streptomyces sp. NPDC092296]|uniref:hypothetical protein n=1 Tax=Streptomyces sp. NPDC092296 TaxID=3366012 RepID=UPI0037FEC75D